MKRRAVLEILSLLFIVLFVYASANKLLDYQRFRIQIGQSPLLTGFGDLIPWMVITLELVTAGMLMIERTRLIAFYSSFILMTMFTAYIVAILNFSSYVPCSCGGVLEHLGWSDHLIFNSVFVGLALLGIILQATEQHAGSRSTKTLIL